MALIDKASLLMVPSTYEAGKLYNVLPSGNRAPDSTDQNSGYDQTRADFDFDRGSNAAATRIGSDGLIKKYRENLLTESNNFSDSDWTKNTIGSVASGHEGYDGTNGAWLITKSSAVAYVNLYQAVSFSGVQTFSVYAKAGTLSAFGIYTSGGTNPYVVVDLSTGTIISSRSSVINKKMEDVGNGWYRVSMAFNETIAGVHIYPDWNQTNTGNLYIQNAQLETGLVATDYLDSGATTAKAGVLVDLPRINYDANGENGSLLLEPSRANFVQYSEYFGAWSDALGCDIYNNTAVSPEGVQNAATISFGGSADSRAFLSFSASSSTYIFSIYAKSSTSKKFRFRISGSGGTQYSADLTTTSEWKRFEFEYTGDISVVGLTNESSATGGSINVFGFQAEAGSYPTSYIPNHGTTGGVTRAADSCSVTGVSDVIGQTEGTIFAEIDSSQFLTGSYISISDGGTSNRQIFGWEAQSGDSGTLRLYGFWNGFAYSSFSKGQKIKVALAYKNNDFALYVNGTQAGTKTSATISGTLSQFGFNSGGGAQKYQGNAYQLALFKERLSNAELATLTTL